MMLSSQVVLDRIVSHAMTTKLFARVNTSENKGLTGKGLVAEIWFNNISPARTASGLNSVAARMQFNIRLRTPTARGNSDQLDPLLIEAVDKLMANYCKDFKLGGIVRNVDVFGETGTELESNSGYITIDDVEYRVVDITLPLIINDVWSLGE